MVNMEKTIIIVHKIQTLTDILQQLLMQRDRHMKINLSKTNEYGEGPECRAFHDERVSRGHF